MKKIISHPVIGNVLIVKGLTNRTLRLSVNAVRGVRLSVPWHVTYGSAIKFLESTIDWVSEAIKRQNEKAKKTEVLPSDGHILKTQAGTIIFRHLNERERTDKPIRITKAKSDGILPGTLREILFDSSVSTEGLNKAVATVLKKDASAILPVRLSELAEKHGFIYGRVALRNNVSNWGSCSARKNINLNIHLIRLPQDLSDYVILHELAHLKHRNHGPEFHRLLDLLCNGREKELSRQLRKFSPRRLFQ
jgi:predicted metal-dependent hydrolase